MEQAFVAVLDGVISMIIFIASHFTKSAKEIDCQRRKTNQFPAVKGHHHKAPVYLNSTDGSGFKRPVVSFTETTDGKEGDACVWSRIRCCNIDV